MMATLKSKGGNRYDRVLRMLDDERAVLLNGPIAELKPLVDRREVLLAAILAEDGDLPEGFLDALQARAERNSRLLLAGIAGLKTAREQVEAAEDARTRLRTYNAAGASVDVRDPGRTHDQRR
jgi:hypothetical protein